MTRLSRLLVPTLRDDPADAEVVSHKLLVRAGMIRQLARGIYDFLPLGLRVVRRVEAIVREEMDRAGAQEILMPAVHPAELWQESGRWDKYGKELLRLKDRNDRDFCFGPTHEEVVTDLVRREVRSYRELPMNLYQIQVKFRDEIRPRFGLMRGREFIMKDAYSFDVDEADARREYEEMYDAYTRIFERCGLDVPCRRGRHRRIGGDLSHEFLVLADSGEDAIVSCDALRLRGQRREGRGAAARRAGAPSGGALERVATPGKRTVEEVAAFLGVPPERFVKTLVYRTAGGDVGGRAGARRSRGERDEAAGTALGGEAVALADEHDGRARHRRAGRVRRARSGSAVRIVADVALRGHAGRRRRRQRATSTS